MAVLGVGIDLVEVSDALRLLDRWGERLLKRISGADSTAVGGGTAITHSLFFLNRWLATWA